MEQDPTAQRIAEAIERDLAQATYALSAIEAFEDARNHAEATDPSLLLDRLMFGTVYNALWDSVIVALGRVWDNAPGVASLPKLALHYKGAEEAAKVRAALTSAAQSARQVLDQLRNKTVAHRAAKLPPSLGSADVALARRDLDEALGYLNLMGLHIRRPRLNLSISAGMAYRDAKESLSGWMHGRTQRRTSWAKDEPAGWKSEDEKPQH